MSDSILKELEQHPITYYGDHLPRRRVLELYLRSPRQFDHPLHEATLVATFTSPSGHEIEWQGFWDGADNWRVRYSPDEEGIWQYKLRLADNQGDEITTSEGTFTTTPALNETVFDRHGPIQLADDKRNLVHADGTPFFWLGDTAWNGPLRSTDDEWKQYIETRLRQRFSAVQWVATHWRAAPKGDIEGQPAFTESEPIAVNPAFFQRMDSKVESIVAAGLLNVPVMLWAIGHGANPTIDPGYGLPEAEAILLGRYEVARWAAYPIVWILAGDGKYFDDYAARWRRIGRAIFGEDNKSHAPVAMHCGGEQWPADELRGEPWIGILGYQSGHGDSDKTLSWMVNGPPATDWAKEPRLFQINLEPAYENHIAYHSKQPLTPALVRMAMYWSLLNAPTAGVSYGGHGVWGWDDGTVPSMDHPNSGVPLPWQQALTMPAAEQIPYLVDFFTSIPWWTLSPAPQLLAEQPGTQDVRRTILVAANAASNLIVAYTPEGGTLHLTNIASGLIATWCNPRTGERQAATAPSAGSDATYVAPDHQDWLLFLHSPQVG